jgi:hypothetical protein
MFWERERMRPREFKKKSCHPLGQMLGKGKGPWGLAVWKVRHRVIGRMELLVPWEEAVCLPESCIPGKCAKRQALGTENIRVKGSAVFRLGLFFLKRPWQSLTGNSAARLRVFCTWWVCPQQCHHVGVRRNSRSRALRSWLSPLGWEAQGPPSLELILG